MKRTFVGLLVWVLLLGFLLPTYARATEITFVMASYHPLTHPLTIVEQKFADELKKRSNGKIVCRFYGAETLTKAKEIFDDVASGRIQMGETYSAYMEGRIPLLGMVVLPGLITSKEGSERVMANGGLDVFQPEYNKYDLTLLHHTWAGGFYPFTNKRPVLKTEDLKGMKIKVAGKTPGDFVAICGGSPVMITGPETYMAAQLGTIDGEIFPAYGVTSYKHYEVLKYGVDNVVFGGGWMPVFANKKWWENLPADARGTILAISTEIIYQEGNKGLEQDNIEAWKIMKEKRMEIFSAAPEQVKRFIDAGTPLVNESLKKWGMPGAKLYEICKKFGR